jgi:division protein CdvB (Snf7/Vps24/ESCRT-III family)
MASQNPVRNRLRVWAFGYTSDVDTFKQMFMDEEIYTKGGDQYVIVRADEVEEFTENSAAINIIIPMDVADEDGLDAVKSVIEELGVEIKATVKSLTKIPDPPHMSHGYITPREFDILPEAGEEPGRQGASPGSNKWG